MHKLLLAGVMIFGLAMPAVAYDPDESDMSADEYDHNDSPSIYNQNQTWYGSSWQSGNDVHSEYHDNNGHTVYCQQYQAGNTVYSDCH